MAETRLNFVGSAGPLDPRRLACWLRCITAAALAAGGVATAQPAVPSADLSFDQLTQMEVSGVSKAAERVLDAPAAVTIITAEDIRAYGFRTLADVLNMAPGFFSYGDRAYTYEAVRGFAPIESYNSRILLLIDGFPTNDSVFQQALTGNEAIVDISLIDRVEIIPGPSSSVYGNNAVLGVINVILKNPSQASTSGQAWTGAGVERGASATYRADDGGDLRYLLQLSGSGSNGLDVVYQPQPGLPQGARASGLDATDVTHAFAKIVDGNLRLNLGFSDRRQGAGYGLYGDVIGDPRSWVSDGATFGDLHYEGSWDDATDYVLRASAAQYRYNSVIVDSYPAGPAPGFLPIDGDWIDTEATATHHFSAHNRLIVGAELRRDLHTEMNYTVPGEQSPVNVSDSDTRAGIYAQSDIDWSPQWSTSIGLRDDSDTGQPNRIDPRLALLWKPTSEQAIKLLSGSAYRDPNFFERFFSQPPYNLPNPALAPERLRTLDLDYELQVNAASRLSLALFRYRAMDLIAQTVVNTSGSTQYLNSASAQARGADLALDEHLLPGLRARLSTEYAFAYDADGNWEQNSPLWTGRLGIDGSLPADWHLGTEALFEGRRLAIDDRPLPAVLLANVALSRAPRPGRVDASLGLYNVFGRGYAQPVAGWTGDSVNQTGRTWRLTVGYSF
jgi:iron complex outermembrane receptor protein